MSETLPLPESKRPDTYGYYRKFSRNYDKELIEHGVIPKFDKLVATAAGHLVKGNVHSTLDLGAGTGVTSTAIKRYATPDRIVAVEPNEGMLGYFRKKHTGPDVSIVQATAEDYVAQTNETFDFVISVGVLELLPDAPEVVRSAAQLLNKNGVLAVTYVPRAEGEAREILTDDSESEIKSSMMEYRWYPNEIESAISDSGLTIIDRVDDLVVQEEDEATNTAERAYSFVVATRSDLPSPIH